MKRNNLIIIFCVIAIIIFGTIIGIIINKSKEEESKVIFDDTSNESFLCGGTICKQKSEKNNENTEYINCENCDKMVLSIYRLCSDCSMEIKECKVCRRQPTKEELYQNNLKLEQYKKIKNISLSKNKISYIPEKNEMAVLVNDENSENKVSKIIVVNMENYEIVREYKLDKDYISDTNMNAKFSNLDQSGRMFFENGKFIVISSSEELSFIYDVEKEKITDSKYKDDECEGTIYYYIKDIETGKEYYYFDYYDMVLNDLEEIDWNKFYLAGKSKYVNDKIDTQIVYNDNNQVLIAYYNQEYGKMKLALFTKDGEELELSELNCLKDNSKKMYIGNRNIVVYYDIEKDEEIWSYNESLQEKIKQEMDLNINNKN